jgi:hypothetical protein
MIVGDTFTGQTHETTEAKGGSCPWRSSRGKRPSGERLEMDAQDDTETTASLLAKVRAGDEEARGRLVVRYGVLLRRWAHGRVPAP